VAACAEWHIPRSDATRQNGPQSNEGVDDVESRSMAASAFAAASIAVVAVIAGGSIASATQTGARVSVIDGAGFYTDDQIGAAWEETVDAFPEALPAGYRLPAAPPPIFHEDSKRHLFAEDLPDMMAAQLWRCAWLDSSPNGTKNVLDDRAALSVLLSTYSQLPSVKENDETGYTVDMLTKFAQENKLAGPAEALFQLDCEGY
jgi:hypothetical protein